MHKCTFIFKLCCYIINVVYDWCMDNIFDVKIFWATEMYINCFIKQCVYCIFKLVFCKNYLELYCID